MEERRKQHNRDLLHRFKTGDNLVAFDETMSFFPPRPLIKKDKKEMARLYNLDEDKKDQKPVPRSAPTALNLVK